MAVIENIKELSLVGIIQSHKTLNKLSLVRRIMNWIRGVEIVIWYKFKGPITCISNSF